MGKIDPKKIRKSFPPSMYENFDKYYREIDYWIVYHGMKDFCDDTFDIEDVRQMRYVHDIAKLVISMSTADSKTIRRVLRTEEGKKLADFIYIFHMPIVNKIDDMTPIQEQFLYQTHPGKTPEILDVSNMTELGNILPNLKKYM